MLDGAWQCEPDRCERCLVGGGGRSWECWLMEEPAPEMAIPERMSGFRVNNGLGLETAAGRVSSSL